MMAHLAVVAYFMLLGSNLLIRPQRFIGIFHLQLLVLSILLMLIVSQSNSVQFTKVIRVDCVANFTSKLFLYIDPYKTSFISVF